MPARGRALASSIECVLVAVRLSTARASVRTCMRMCLRLCLCLCLCFCVDVDVCLCIYVHLSLHLCLCLRLCLYLCVCVRTRVRARACVSLSVQCASVGLRLPVAASAVGERLCAHESHAACVRVCARTPSEAHASILTASALHCMLSRMLSCMLCCIGQRWRRDDPASLHVRGLRRP